MQRLRGFRPIDDTFMRVLFRDNLPLAQYVLRVITGKQDLRLTKEETQKDLVRLVGARGLCLDVHGVDDENRQYDFEVQRADAGARPERARYHAGALDVENLDAGQDISDALIDGSKSFSDTAIIIIGCMGGESADLPM